MSTVDRIRSNAAFRKYEKVLDRMESFDLLTVAKEAKALHAGRTSRTLHTSDISPKSLTEAVFKDMAYRARLIELRVSVMDRHDRLSTVIDVVRKYLITRYGDQLQARSIAAKRHAIDTLLREGMEMMARMESLSGVLDYYVKDIDQAGYGLKNAVSLLQLIYKPETKV